MTLVMGVGMGNATSCGCGAVAGLLAERGDDRASSRGEDTLCAIDGAVAARLARIRSCAWRVISSEIRFVSTSILPRRRLSITSWLTVSGRWRASSSALRASNGEKGSDGSGADGTGVAVECFLFWRSARVDMMSPYLIRALVSARGVPCVSLMRRCTCG